MLYVQIPGTELMVSVICMGGGPFIDLDRADESFALLDLYRELGGNFIDTANVYGKWLPAGLNSSEITLGRWMSERGNRADIVLATKGGHPDLSSMNVPRLTRAEVEKDLDESLKALRTDYIDLYWLHRDDEQTPVAVIIDYLNDLVKKGKIRYFGCSNWRPARIREALDYAGENGLQAFTGNQLLWNLAVLNEDAFDDKTLAAMDGDGYGLHRETGLAAIPYSSQANGFFSKLEGDPAGGSLGPGIRRAYYNEENLRRYARAKEVSSEHGLSIAQVALAYLTSQPFVTVPIVGCRTLPQLRDSMGAGEVMLDGSTIEYLRCGP